MDGREVTSLVLCVTCEMIRTSIQPFILAFGNMFFHMVSVIGMEIKGCFTWLLAHVLIACKLLPNPPTFFDPTLFQDLLIGSLSCVSMLLVARLGRLS